MRVIGGGGCHVLLLQAVVLGTPHIGIAAFSCCSGCRGQGVVEEEGAAAASHGGRRGSRVREISQKWKGSVVADTAQSSSKATGRAYHLRISSSQGLHPLCDGGTGQEGSGDTNTNCFFAFNDEN